MNYYLSARAEEDMIGIAVFFIEHWGDTSACTYVDDLYATFEMLAERPRLGMVCVYVRQGYRKFPKEEHLVVYRIHANDVEVVRILHGSMDVARQFADDDN